MIIYAVEAGDYSDYHIVGLYTTYALAEKAKQAYVGYNLPEIAEYETDQQQTNLDAGLRRFCGFINEFGEMSPIHEDTHITADTAFVFVKKVYNQPPRVLRGTLWAENAQHAAKILREKWAQCVAEGWPT